MNSINHIITQMLVLARRLAVLTDSFSALSTTRYRCVTICFLLCFSQTLWLISVAHFAVLSTHDQISFLSFEMNTVCSALVSPLSRAAHEYSSTTLRFF
jgi:hypothetical protein